MQLNIKPVNVKSQNGSHHLVSGGNPFGAGIIFNILQHKIWDLFFNIFNFEMSLLQVNGSLHFIPGASTRE